MGVLVKTVHAAVAMGKDPQTEVQRRLMNYRNTPHPSRGKSPSELIMNRRLKTKIPARLATSDAQVHREDKEKTRAPDWTGRWCMTGSTRPGSRTSSQETKC